MGANISIIAISRVARVLAESLDALPEEIPVPTPPPSSGGAIPTGAATTLATVLKPRVFDMASNTKDTIQVSSVTYVPCSGAATVEEAAKLPGPLNRTDGELKVILKGQEGQVNIRALHKRVNDEIVRVLYEIQTNYPSDLKGFLSRIAYSGITTPAELANALTNAVNIQLTPSAVSNAIHANITNFDPVTGKSTITIATNHPIISLFPKKYFMSSIQSLLTAAYAGALIDTLALQSEPVRIVISEIFISAHSDTGTSLFVTIVFIVIMLAFIFVAAMCIWKIDTGHLSSYIAAKTAEAHESICSVDVMNGTLKCYMPISANGG